LTDSVHAAINSQRGTVDHIVVPNLEHYIQIASWKAVFPDAIVIGPGGLREKCSKKPALSGVQLDIILTSSNSNEKNAALSIVKDLASEFDVKYIDSVVSHKLVLLHRPSRTLLEADLLFNGPATEKFSQLGKPPTPGMFEHSFCTIIQPNILPYGRSVWLGIGAKDCTELAWSLERINSRDFDRLVPCHRDIIDTGAKEVFRHAFDWFLEGENKRL
jgi:hypothetical protein